MFISCLFLVLFASIGFSEAQYDNRHSNDDYMNYDDYYLDEERDSGNEETKRMTVNTLKYLLGLVTKDSKDSALPPRKHRPLKLIPHSRPGKVITIGSKDEFGFRADDGSEALKKNLLEQLDAAHRIYAALEEHGSGN